MNKKLNKFFSKFKKQTDKIYTHPSNEGYWSNLSKEENTDLIKLLEKHTTREAVSIKMPMISDVIFSEKRPVGLELLNLSGKEVAIDLGCMWGAITIPLAKQVDYVLGVDQTLESLKFTEARLKEEEIKNASFLNANLRDFVIPEKTFDIAIVNGVLEWLPEVEDVELSNYWYKRIKRKAQGNPRDIQLDFLKNVNQGLTDDGRLMLAIENRYDYKMFFGTRDPHTGTLFTTISPRWLANIISLIFRKREYRPWIYSFNGTKKLLMEAGYSDITLYSCWPDYRFPEFINKYGEVNNYFSPTSSIRNGKRTIKGIIANRVEWLLFKVFNFQFFAPSMIIIAKK